MSGTKLDPSEITIRAARREDIRRVVTLIMLGAAKLMLTPAEIEAEAAHPAYESSFGEIQASPDNTLFVAERGGEVVGAFQVTLIPGLISRGRKRAKLESVHVAPECRGMGVGAAMIAFALDFAKGKGAELVELTSNKSRTDAHRFYRNLGFDQSHEGFKKLV
jgi:ribosomal protein S18 acetylase RimI-like enzyme